MSDNPTQETPDSRSFEERVFARFDALDGRLTTLEERVDSRLRETRPIWEAVLTRLTGVEERVGNLEAEMRQVRRTMRALHEDVLQTRGEQVGLDDDIGKLNERVEKLESQSTP
jgi:septal ring factor EnvC (AmiA/AmiB activator)